MSLCQCDFFLFWGIFILLHTFHNICFQWLSWSHYILISKLIYLKKIFMSSKRVATVLKPIWMFVFMLISWSEWMVMRVWMCFILFELSHIYVLGFVLPPLKVNFTVVLMNVSPELLTLHSLFHSPLNTSSLKV